MEKWTGIDGFPGYEASTFGRVKSFRRYKEGRILSPGMTGRGYLSAALYSGGNRKTVSVHRIIATSFIPNPLNKPEINHINGVKHDNRADNLEWCTHSENVKHGFDNGIIAKAWGEGNGNAKLTSEQVREIRGIKGEFQRVIGERYGIGQANVGRILRGVLWPNV